MRETTVKISVTQDGLLPEEVTLLGKIFLPIIQKQILKSTGFEKIDDSTYAGVVPIKITTNAKIQEIEFEVGAIPDFRKKVVEFVNQVSIQEFIEVKEEVVEEKPSKKSKTGSTDNKKSKAKSEKTKEKKSSKKDTVKKKATTKKSPIAKKATTKKSPIAKKAATKKTVNKKPVKKKVATKKTSAKGKRSKK